VPHASYPDPGMVAFDAYSRATGGRTYDDRPMPAWDNLGDAIQDAWQAAARAVIDTARAADTADNAVEQFTTSVVGDPQTPSLGHIVLVAMDPASNNGAPTSPAVITRIWPNDLINVRALPDAPTPTKAMTSLSYVDTVDDLAPGRWTWPPRT
jgi:hypothetical protein